MNITITEANIIEQALKSEDGTAKFWRSQTTHHLVKVLNAHGMTQIGFEASPVRPADRHFWGVWKVVDRDLAAASIEKFRKTDNPIEFTLTPFEKSDHYDDYHCPKCNGDKIQWTDGDSISVPVLPEGINDYNDIDTVLMVGTCQGCQEPLYFYEYGFTTVTDPSDDDYFCVSNLVQIPDKYQMYKAEAPGIEPWVLSRRWYDTGQLHESLKPEEGAVRLPKGPFVVDYHHFGPFSLESDGELSGPYGVSMCGGSGENDKWEVGTMIFNRLAKNAMNRLLTDTGFAGPRE